MQVNWIQQRGARRFERRPVKVIENDPIVSKSITVEDYVKDNNQIIQPLDKTITGNINNFSSVNLNLNFNLKISIYYKTNYCQNSKCSM